MCRRTGARVLSSCAERLHALAARWLTHPSVCPTASGRLPRCRPNHAQHAYIVCLYIVLPGSLLISTQCAMVPRARRSSWAIHHGITPASGSMHNEMLRSTSVVLCRSGRALFTQFRAVAYALVDSCPLASSSLAARVHIPHRLFMSTPSRCRRVHVCLLFKSPTAGEQMREHSQTHSANASLSRLCYLLRRVGAIVHDATVRLRQFERLSERATCFSESPDICCRMFTLLAVIRQLLATACVANPVLEVPAAEQLQYLSSG